MSEGKARRLLRSRRFQVGAALGVLVLAGAAAGAYYLYKHRRPGSVYHPHARFIPQPTPRLPAKGPERFAWPLYGYNKNHTRFFPASEKLRPPYIHLWQHNVGSLLEFPPVIYGERLFQLADNAVLNATDKHDGHIVWSRQLGELSASTPAVNGKTVYATVLATGSGGPAGRVWALNSATGQTRWARSLPAPSESSPMLDGDKLFFGTQSGIVYALNARNGDVLWTYHAEGAVKASPTLSDGVLYFGDYSGHVQAVSEASGRRLWMSGTEGGVLGGGNFYSTCAVVYGRVFLGNTDGRIYAYDAQSGRLDWAVQTGAYVYSSPAVTDAPGLGPTIYLGSYDGTFYAINARSGQVSWRFGAGGRISGSATILGKIVYFADLGDHLTYGLGISTGRVLYRANTGSFDPVISDGKHIFLTGTTGLYAIGPRP